MARKIFITRELPGPALNFLAKNCEVEVNKQSKALSREEILLGARDKDGLLCLLTDTIDEGIIKAGQNLKIIANYAVGYNNIDIKTATERGIMVTNTPGVLTETTADLTFALILSCARRIVEADKFTRQEKFSGWAPSLFLGNDVYGKTLGIVGMGRIGRAVAKRGALGFEMKILYSRKSGPDRELEKKFGYHFVDLENLLKESDFVSIHVPLTEETKYLIGENELKKMKKTAFLINTSRGPVIDEKALVSALKKGVIQGAGLDVFENEPELTRGLIDLDNVVIPPHIGSATIETRSKMAMIAAENLLAGLEGKKPPNLVNPEALSEKSKYQNPNDK